MNMPHKHAEIIKAWADGEIIQYKPFHTWEWEDWVEQSSPTWLEKIEYRIKPKLKEIFLCTFDNFKETWYEYKVFQKGCKHQIKITFDEETDEIKFIDIIK